jgi:uncharacterized membrane protein (UPF0127 family)
MDSSMTDPRLALPRVAAAWATLLALALLLSGCAAPTPSETSSGLSTLAVTLPSGVEIRAELAVTPEQQRRGLMFRDALPPNGGMLFIFPDSSERGFWMYQTRIPLDIIWLDENRRVVEISAHTPPCADPEPRNCPSYGGQSRSKYVLELAAGEADALGLGVGDQIRF